MSGEGNAASKISLPEAVYSDTNGTWPHPTTTLPLGSVWVLPMYSEWKVAPWEYWRTTVAVWAA